MINRILFPVGRLPLHQSKYLREMNSDLNKAMCTFCQYLEVLFLVIVIGFIFHGIHFSLNLTYRRFIATKSIQIQQKESKDLTTSTPINDIKMFNLQCFRCQR